MKFFKYLQYIFLICILGISIIILYLWNIQQDLPDHNISQYFPNEITKIYDEKYELMYHVGNRDRFYLDYKDIPENMIKAIISAEDKTFFQHQGFDIKGIVNAFIINLKNIYSKNNNNYVGASTITQQLVKNILLNRDQTISRKIKELILSLRIEQEYSKEFIIELYLNEIYFGRRSYGVASASFNYFNKSIFDLDIHEYAYLAALPKGPNNYDPKKNYNKALERRNYVLKQMELNKFITSDQFNFYSNLEIEVYEKNNKKYKSDYKTDFILNYLNENSFDENAFYIQSTIDQTLQKISEKSLLDNLALFERKYRKWSGSYKNLEEILKYKNDHWHIARVISKNLNKTKLSIINSAEIININNENNYYGPEKISPDTYLSIDDYIFVTNIDNIFYAVQLHEINGSVIIMDPFNGNIVSMVGGVNYDMSNFNRVTQAYRQPGSSIKPFIYAHALETKKFLPNTLILDSNILLDQGNNLPVWVPKNYSNKSYGELTFRRALETSNNLVTLKIGLDLGLNSVNEFLDKINFYNKNIKSDVYSTLLGAVENNLLNLTTSYSIFLNGGYIVEPSIIKKVVSNEGELIVNNEYFKCNYCSFSIDDRSYRLPTIESQKEKVISPQTSFQILNILEGAIERGTGKSLNKIDYPIAGKTGTTNESKDLWFFGLTPRYVIGVYVGYDTPKSIGYRETGSSVALPIFKTIIENYLLYSKNTNDKFILPSDLIIKKVNKDNGEISDGQSTIIDYFTKEQLEILDNINKIESIGGIN
jgi:penicillin-binding protein 1A